MRRVQPDELAEDLAKLRSVAPADVAHGVIDGMIDNFSDPAYRVEFFAALITVVPCARMRLRFLPTMLVALAAGKAAAWAYTLAEEIRAGVTTRQPKCSDASDAPGRI
jgi:hypothetical protein